MESIDEARARLQEIASLKRDLEQEEVELRAYMTVASLLQERLQISRKPEVQIEPELPLDVTGFNEEKPKITKKQPMGKTRKNYEKPSTPQKEIWALVEKTLRHRGRPMRSWELWEVLKTQDVHLNGDKPHIQLSSRLCMMPNIASKHIKGKDYVWWFKEEPIRYSHDVPEGEGQVQE